MLKKYLEVLGLLFLINPCSIFLLLVLVVIANGYRLILIILAKWVRPDLRLCMSGMTNSNLVNDWFSETPPRSTIVIKNFFRHIRTRKWAEKQVLRRWITAKLENSEEYIYPQFSQYPYRWFGYTFWKNYETFDVRNHVFGHSDETGETDLQELTEKLLNEPYPRERSPWEIHIFENYNSTSCHEKVSSVLILKYHHCLGDGYSLLGALIEGIYQTPMSTLGFPKPRRVKKTLAQNVNFVFTFPFSLVYEFFGLCKYGFEYCPWKAKDTDKEWHMTCSQSQLIPMQNIKDIKNKFGVSFTSVLVSAISAGIGKITNGRLDDYQNGKTLCLSTLPLGLDKRQNRLTNHVTAAFFPIPTGKFYTTSIERLQKSNCLLENNRNSVIPYAARIYTTILGSLFTKAASFIGKNRCISVALTNLPGLPLNREGTGLENIVFGEYTLGGLEGVCGLVFTVGSSAPYIKIGVSAEQAVLSGQEIEDLVKSVEDEINILHAASIRDVNLME